MSTIILLLTHVEFLAYIFILVYVGGIAILFLFIIIMLNIKASSLNKQSAKNNLIYGFFFSIIFFLKLNMLFLLLKKSFINSYFIDHFSMTKFPALHPGDDTLNIILSNDIKVFGLILYTHYFFYFLLVGLILLVTMVCVLVLALNKPLDNLEEYKPVRIKTKEKELMVDLYNKFFKKKYSTHEPRLNFMVNNTPIIVPCKGPRDWDLE
jgi:NADH:ubiquinone oxidoreductase subunit 6 (subunit J)